MQKLPIRDDFPNEFFDALGRVLVAFGRVEYMIKLCVKALHAQGFTEGIAHAESRGQFHRLCACAKDLATQKLPADKAARFHGLIDLALASAPSRNDNAHACWTTDDSGVPLRLRPFWKRKKRTVEWRSGTVTVDALRQIAAAMDNLFQDLERDRHSWPTI